MAASTSGTTCPTTGRYTTMRDSTERVARAAAVAMQVLLDPAVAADQRVAG